MTPSPTTESARWSPNDWLRLIALLGGFLLFGLGGWMLFQGIAVEGTVDLKSSVLSGSIKASSAGLYICFFALFVIVFVLVTLLAPAKRSAVTTTKNRVGRLMSVFWGTLIALGISALALAVLPENGRFGFSLAAGILSAVLGTVVVAILRMVNESDS